MPRERFPILGTGRSVPWDFMAPHEEQAQVNHGQTLERLAQRGGLDPAEMLAVVEGIKWASIGKAFVEEAPARLDALLAKWESEQ